MEEGMNRQFTTKKELVVELLRELILSGDLVPGERLLQEDLARRLDVSPTPVREALQQLQAEGILQHSPHKGVRVAEARLEAVEEIYAIRSVLERLATERAVPNLSRADLKRLRDLQAKIQVHSDNGELKKLRRLNYEMHMTIYRAAKMPELYEIIRMLWTKFPWDTLHIIPHRADKSIWEHQQVLDAIEAGEAAVAAERMQKHIEFGANSLREFLSSQSPA
jgi:DNA-binding GntR family transcriptional regulator